MLESIAEALDLFMLHLGYLIDLGLGEWAEQYVGGSLFVVCGVCQIAPMRDRRLMR